MFKITEEQKSLIKIGDTLKCLKGDWHFETNCNYIVYGDSADNTGTPVIWCDEVSPHTVKSLNVEQWEIVQEKSINEVKYERL
ncbi:MULTISPECIES: hypothetical protein [Bacillus]|uniref:hypothetical protein n=1 Tax=Bacillus TaxID=1386 RepID=UPI001E2DEEA0|nr:MULTISPECIES: hypothetical protein [Bacillus]MDR4910732.1 hypothetical protein [Bacillus subtilis]UEG55522.1 hypothetical protein LK685_11690 [Bacillus sp. BC1-43]